MGHSILLRNATQQQNGFGNNQLSRVITTSMIFLVVVIVMGGVAVMFLAESVFDTHMSRFLLDYPFLIRAMALGWTTSPVSLPKAFRV